MKKYILILFTLFIFTTISAQNVEKAKEILDKVSKTTKAYKSITADFDFIMKNTEADINETNSGHIIIQNNRYKLNISGVDIYNDGTTQWTYMSDAMEVNIADAESDEEGAMNPATIFTIYENGYDFNYIGEVSIDSKKMYQIELIPTEDQEFSKVTLFIETTNYAINQAKMIGNDGNDYEIKIKTFDTSKEYQPSTFVLDPSTLTDVDIIDMR